VTHKLPIVVVLLNNGVLGMVRQWQALFFDKRFSQTTLERKTDFPALAKAFGAHGFSAGNLDDLREILKSLPSDAPCLIDCKIDKDEMVYPMIPPGGSARDIITEQSGR
ncbi:MAG: thiamine pyrophosphate-dependent enzyme, partial [Treponema sp.]|nr:thiamine pyrophosphate-dependent enzyme [Treponema sp.]